MPLAPARRLSGSSSPARPFSTVSAPPVSSIVRRTSIAEPSILSTRKFGWLRASATIASTPNPMPMYSGAF